MAGGDILSWHAEEQVGAGEVLEAEVEEMEVEDDEDVECDVDEEEDLLEVEE